MSIILVDFIDVRDIAIPIPFWVGGMCPLTDGCSITYGKSPDSTRSKYVHFVAVHRKFCEPDPASSMPAHSRYVEEMKGWRIAAPTPKNNELLSYSPDTVTCVASYTTYR